MTDRATLGSAAIPVPTRGVKTTADVEPEAIDWIWYKHLPAGKLVVIDGDPSVGKSTLTIDLVARLSSGAPWPDGAPNPGPADSLLLSAEDGLADTTVPRLIAGDADRSRVHALTEVPIVVDDEGTVEWVPPSLPRDIGYIEGIIRKHRVRLVIVDVLAAFLSGKVDSHRDQDVRSVLHLLATMAERTGCCIVLLRHLNKAGGSNPLYRGGGSIGIVGAARAAFLVARDPEDPERRVFAVTKLNIAVEPPALAYRLESHAEQECAHIVWEGVSDHTAASLLAQPATAEERTEVDDAADWLRDFLVMGRAARTDVIAAAKKEGHTQRTLERARQKLGITTVRSGFPGKATWALPGTPVPAHEPGGTTATGGTTGDDQDVSDAQLCHVVQLTSCANPSESWND